jgi:hypothetical protein
MNRKWAESYPDFWQKWRKWLKDVPPAYRPDLREIAMDFGISLDEIYPTVSMNTPVLGK